LAADDDLKRRALMDKASLEPDQLRQAVLALCDEAARSLGDPPSMERITLDAMALATRSNDPYLDAMALMRYGEVSLAQSRFDDAVRYCDEAATLFTRLDMPVEAARTRMCWIVATSSLGQPREALKAASAAQRVFEAHHESERLATLHLNVSLVSMHHGLLRLTLRRSVTALRLFRSLGEAGSPGAGRCHLNRGLAYTRLGRMREALAEFALARGIFTELGIPVDLARVTRGIAEAQMGLGHYAAAILAFEETLAAFLELGHQQATPMIALDMGDCYLRLNRPEDALRVLQEAQADLERLGVAHYVVGFATLRVTAHLLLGHVAQARDALDEAEHRYPDVGAHYRTGLALQRARLLLREGLPAEALVAARRAGSLARGAGMRRLVADAVTIEGTAMLGLGDVDGAARAASRAHRIARAVGAAPVLHRVQELLGAIAEAKGRDAAACRHYAAAIGQLEREQRGVIFAFRDSFALDRGTAYERLAALQLRAGHASAALATAERAKSRALVDAIRGAVELRPRGDATVRRLGNELARAREDYAAATRAADDAAAGNGKALDQPIEPVANLEARIAGLIERLQVVGASDAAGLHGARADDKLPELPPRTAMLEFFFSGDDVLRFWVDAAGIDGQLLSGIIPELRRLLQAFRLNLDATEHAQGDRRTILAAQARQVLRRLHRILLADLPAVEGYNSLVIVPHGLLHYLPFHALFDGESYLIERVAVSYAPSAALYGVCRSRRPRRGNGLVLANSSGGRLPFAIQEGTVVATVWVQHCTQRRRPPARR